MQSYQIYTLTYYTASTQILATQKYPTTSQPCCPLILNLACALVLLDPSAASLSLL